MHLGEPQEHKHPGKNILFFKKFEESVKKVSDRSERKMALFVKGLIPKIDPPYCPLEKLANAHYTSTVCNVHSWAQLTNNVASTNS